MIGVLKGKTRSIENTSYGPMYWHGVPQKDRLDFAVNMHGLADGVHEHNVRQHWTLLGGPGGLNE